MKIRRRTRVVNGFFKGWSHFYREDKREPRTRTMKCSMSLTDLQIRVVDKNIIGIDGDKEWLGLIYLDLRSAKALHSYLDRAIEEIQARINTNIIEKWWIK